MPTRLFSIFRRMGFPARLANLVWRTKFGFHLGVDLQQDSPNGARFDSPGRLALGSRTKMFPTAPKGRDSDGGIRTTRFWNPAPLGLLRRLRRRDALLHRKIRWVTSRPDCQRNLSEIPPGSQDLLRLPALSSILFALLFLAGCQRPDDIVRYTVARSREVHSPASTAANDDGVWVPGQLLGAIVPQGQQTWFFKLTGRLELVKPQLEPFLAFMKSVRLTDKGPEWALPEGWEQLPGSDIRFATLKIPTEKKPLEMTVIPLPTGPGDAEDYLLDNVNRWRDQLRQEPISKAELPDRTVKIELGETPAWLVNFEGQVREGGTTMPPFAGKQPPRAAAASFGANEGTLPFTCKVPESWQPAQANAMQLAAYEVVTGKRKVTISVSSAGGNLAGNI